MLAQLLLAVVAATAAPANGDVVPNIDAFIAAEMARDRIPGIALAVVKDGAVVLARGYGLANVEHRVPVTPDTIFQSGSIGKQFTATAVLLLEQDGRLSVDDPVEKHLGPVPAAWKTMTVRHLLSHTSGLQDYPDRFDLRRDYTESELLEIARASPLAFAPGDGWTYSNLGYVTLGILVGKVSGKFYGDFLAEGVFGPLGMKTARVISEEDVIPNRAAGYRMAGGALKNQVWVAPAVNTTADGSLYLSLRDMLRWEEALDAGRPLAPGGLARMWTPQKLNGGGAAPYGFGWFSRTAKGRRAVFHGGFWQGFKSCIARFPDDRLTVILLANLADAREWRLTRGVAAAFLPDLALPGAPLEDPEPQVSALARKILRQLVTTTPDPALFTTEGRAGLTPERVRVLRARLDDTLSLPIAIVGSLEHAGRTDEGDARVYRYFLTDLMGEVRFAMRLARDGKVAAIDVEP